MGTSRWLGHPPCRGAQAGTSKVLGYKWEKNQQVRGLSGVGTFFFFFLQNREFHHHHP